MAAITNSTFDPYNQTITFLLADGRTPYSISMHDIDHDTFYLESLTINYGSQLGACFVMFFVMIILTKPGKRTSPMFILNILSLALGFFRMLFLCFYFTSSWLKFYPSNTGDVNAISSRAKAISVLGTIPPVLMQMTVSGALYLQAQTVTNAMSNLWRYGIMGLSLLVVLTAIGIRFAECVTNSMAITTNNTYWSHEWLEQATLISETVVIWFFCVIFTSKLITTLIIRKKNGWKQWSALRVLAAMGCCTMIIPCK